MKDGWRVYDADTHVLPAAEVIERYVDPGFRPRLAEAGRPTGVPIRQSAEHSAAAMHGYRVAQQSLSPGARRGGAASGPQRRRPLGAAAIAQDRRAGSTTRQTGSRISTMRD